MQDAPGVAGGPHAGHRLVARDDPLALHMAARLGPHLQPGFQGLGCHHLEVRLPGAEL